MEKAKRSKGIKILIGVLALLAVVLLVIGVGPHESSSAGADLTEQLKVLHGEPNEQMTFHLESADWIGTNWNFRNMTGWDYRYRCQVVYTRQMEDGTTATHTVTYTAYDPMGRDDDMYKRAYLDEDSREETWSPSREAFESGK